MRRTIDDVTIRTSLAPGDAGIILNMHGCYYAGKYGYGTRFESYVALGLHEFLARFDPDRDRVWLCEHEGRPVGSLLLMHRDGCAAQLRYFLILPEYRGIGLGKHLMQLFVNCLHERPYRSSFLWTTDELSAAASLYTRHGFVLSEEKTSRDFGKTVLAQRYDLTLDNR